eukprot:200200_1
MSRRSSVLSASISWHDPPIKQQFSDTMEAIIIGDSGVGKTSLIRRYVQNKYSDYIQTSIGVDSMGALQGLSDGTEMDMKIWDTAGQEKFQSVCTMYYRRADAIIVCYSVENTKTFYNCSSKWIKQIVEYSNDNAVVILVGCKGDKLNKNNKCNDDIYGAAQVLITGDGEHENETLIHILKANNLYDDLYKILIDNNLDYDTLETIRNKEEIDDLCKELKLVKTSQKLKFRKLINAISKSNVEMEEQKSDNISMNLISESVLNETINQPNWKQFNAQYCQCSARTGDNVTNVFQTVAEMVLQKRKKLQKMELKALSQNKVKQAQKSENINANIEQLQQKDIRGCAC